MRCTTTIAAVIFGLVAASASQAAGKLEALREAPNYRNAVFSTAQKTNVWIAEGCAAATARLSGDLGVVKTPDVDDKGAPQAGAWIEHILVEGCGISRQLNVLVNVAGPGSVEMTPLLPGTTRADPTLQKDGATFAFTAVTTEASKGCTSIYVADTRFLSMLPDPPLAPGKPGWSERWTIVQCATKADVTLRFVPDQTGTRITATRAPP